MKDSNIADLESILDDLETSLADLRLHLEFHSRAGNTEEAEALEAEINKLSRSYDQILDRLNQLES